MKVQIGWSMLGIRKRQLAEQKACIMSQKKLLGEQGGKRQQDEQEKAAGRAGMSMGQTRKGYQKSRNSCRTCRKRLLEELEILQDMQEMAARRAGKSVEQTRKGCSKNRKFCTAEQTRKGLKVPKHEIFDRSNFPHFYAIKSSWVCDLVVKILTYYFNF